MSVIIPTYNRAGIISRAIDSVLVQQVTGEVEIIVADDGSTDGTNELIRQRYPGVVYVWQSNQGPAAARNRGIESAKGEYIAFLDSDDEWTPGSLALRVELLESLPTVDLVFSDFEDVADGHVVEKSFLHSRDVWSRVQRHPLAPDAFMVRNFFDCQLVQPLVQPSTVVMRREALVPGQCFDEQLWGVEDWEFWLRFGQTHTVACVDRLSARRHLQDDNMTRPNTKWLEMNTRVGEQILRSYALTAGQRKFVRRRVAEDLFDWGYHVFWVERRPSVARRLWWRSLTASPTVRAVKCLLYAALPGFRHIVDITRSIDRTSGSREVHQ